MVSTPSVNGCRQMTITSSTTPNLAALNGAIFSGTGGSSTRALVTHVRMAKLDRELVARWRLVDAAGVLGFEVSAGGQRLNHRLIAVHVDWQYVYRTRWTGKGLYRLTVLLGNGRRVSVLGQ